MFHDVHSRILNLLKAELTFVLPPESIYYGAPPFGITSSSIAMNIAACRGKDEGIGGSVTIKMDTKQESFPLDGKTLKFPLSEPPVKQSLVVESPKGNLLQETDDYTVEYDSGILLLRNPLDTDDHRLWVTYTVNHALAEIVLLKFVLWYTFTISDPTREGRDSLTEEVLKILSLKRSVLLEKPEELKPYLTEILFLQGTFCEADKVFTSQLEYNVDVVVPVERELKLVERIEIKQK